MKIFVRTLLTVFALCLLGASCTKEDKDDAALPESIKNFIASNKACECEPFVDQYLWKSSTVYVISCKGPACDCMTLYYDKNGAEIKMSARYRFDDFFSESNLIKNVWTCKLSQ